MKQLKRGLAFLLVLVMMVTSMGVGVMAAPAKTKKASIKSVTITKPDTKTLVMKKGKTFTIKTKVTTTGKGKISKAVTYSSSNKKVATVSSKGKIKALKNGKTTITVTSKANKKKKATLKVVVNTPVTKVALDKKTLELTEGETATLKATVSPKDATVKKVQFTSSKPEVIKVDSKGNVTALAEGTAVITAKATDGNGKKATCTVKVTKKVQEQKPADTDKKDDSQGNGGSQDNGGSSNQGGSGDNGGSTKPEDPKPTEPEKPVEPEDPEEPIAPLVPEDKEYKLVWQDEFDSDSTSSVSINSADWNIELRKPGWVNNELQEYVDSEDNIYMQDGKLVIQASKTEKDGKTYYTSGRVNTLGKHDFKYGKFEAKLKVPAGQGYLPAFWMMPADEDLYGQWPKCGEIDIMEVLGNETDKAYGTIHFGEPHAEKQGSKTVSEGEKDYSEEYHTFSCEWEPGSIKWYIDDVLYHEANDWYSTTDGQGTVAYPAPFDQPFYIILNLAVGGNWPGNPDEMTSFDEKFMIDYVRVYQKSENYYKQMEKAAEKPEKEPVTEPADGKYVSNSDFREKEDLTDDEGWKFLTASGGEATATISENEIRIETTKAGTENHSVQLVQAGMAMKQGNIYRLSFEAYADDERTMITDISAPDRSWKRYFADTTVNLTTKKQTFTFDDIRMEDEDDANGRIEFNLGKNASTATVHITNVKLEKTGTFTIDTSKKVLADGNFVYNGKFQEGMEEGKKFMQYWDVETSGSGKAKAAVTSLTDGRRVKVTSAGCSSVADVALKQTELPLAAGKYELSFDGQTENKDGKIKVKVAGKTFEACLTTENQPFVYTFEIPENATIADIDDIVFEVGVNGAVLLDNIKIVEDTLIKNGSFHAGTAGYEFWNDASATQASWGVDSITEKNIAAQVTIKNTGTQDWHIQLKQNYVPLEKGKNYKLSFQARTTLEGGRQIRAILQGGEDKGWSVYSGENIVDLTNEYQTFTKVFTMTEDTDPEAFLSICMGKVDRVITEEHQVCIDDIVLEETDEVPEEPEEPAEPEEPEEPEEPAEPIVPVNTEMMDISKLTSQVPSDGKVTVSGNQIIAEVASVGSNAWDVEVKQVDLTFEKGCTYEYSFKVKSSIARTIQAKVQQDGNVNGNKWDVYSSKNFALTADSETIVKEQFVMDKATDDKVLFAIDMGNFDKTELVPHTIIISDLSLKKIKEADGSAADVVTGQNMLQNADFAEDVNHWSCSLGENGALGSYVTSEGKIEYHVDSCGDNEWDVVLEQSGLSLENGKKYLFTCKVVSNKDRKIKYTLQKATAGYDWYGGETLDLKAGVLREISYAFTMSTTCENARINFNMGKLDIYGSDGNWESTYVPEEAAIITLSDFSLVEVTE